MKRINKIVCLLLSLAFSLTAMAQQLNIAGTVIDEKGEPVAGASVIVKGSTSGAITDVSGNYSIQAPSDATLVISSAGMADKEEAIGGRGRIDVQMATAANELDELVMVGYAVQKKAHLTGAVATVAPTEITDLAAIDLSTTLQGLVSGVSVSTANNRPGEVSRIIIRDPGQSVGGTAEQRGPLFVIDDFISTAETFNNLDPNMVESISILKDAAAAVYGSRSAQGVVLVRTKRGQVGKPKISYSGQVGFADEFYRPKLMDAYSYGQAYNAMSAAEAMRNKSTLDRLKELYQYDELEAMKGMNYDLLDQYWSPAVTQKHGVTVSGGNEHANFFGGVSYQTQDGNMGRMDYSRWNYRAGMDAKINKWTKASIALSGDNGSNYKTNNRVGGMGDDKDYVTLMSHLRHIPEYITDPNNPNQQLALAPYGITNSAALNSTQNNHFGVVEEMGDFRTNVSQNMVLNSSLEYDFGWSSWLKGLKFRATYSKSISNTKDNQYGSMYNLYKFADGTEGRGGSGNHLFVSTPEKELNFDGMSMLEIINGSSSFLRRDMQRTDNYQLNFIVSYARTFGNHDVSGLFTMERSENESENLWGNVSLPYSFTNYQSNTTSGDQTTEFNRSEAGMLSYVGRLNYAYADKYLVEFLMRTDASTKFAPENYWGVFPQLSLGWIMSKESWFSESVQFVDFLKLRGSFGLVGRDNIDAWAWQQTYSVEKSKGPIFGGSPSIVAGEHFQVPSSVPNREATWDKIYKMNLGIDANFLNNRLSFGFDGYYDRARDVFESLSTAPDFPTTVGASTAKSNYGSTDTYGVEFSIGWRDKIGSDFKYWAKLNTSYSGNKRIKFVGMDDPMRKYSAIQKNGSADVGKWGLECLGMFRSYQEIAEYFAENNIVDYFGMKVGDVQPGMLIYRDIRGSQKTDGTYYASGDATDPEYIQYGGNRVNDDDQIKVSERDHNIYGFTLNFGGEWKGLSVSAQLGASWGYYDMMKSEFPKNMTELDYTNLPLFYAGDMFVYNNVYDERGRMVVEQNLNAAYPTMIYQINGKESTFWMVNAANVFLRNLTVAYTLPKAWVNKIGLESARLNLTGQNLFELYNPYPDKFRAVNSDYAKYPMLRRFTLGLNVSF